MKLPVYNLEGRKTGKTVDLPAEIFALKVNPVLIQEAVEAQRSKSRPVSAHTKTRAERRGGGAKPWAQKGTGRARAGSRRSPLWHKGGVIFGPRPERNFRKKINKKARRKAILMVLSERANSQNITIVEMLKIPRPQTKKLLALLKKLPLKQKPLILLGRMDRNIKLAARNLPKVKVLPGNSLNVVDLVNYDSILMPQEVIKIIEETYSNNKVKRQILKVKSQK